MGFFIAIYIVGLVIIGFMGGLHLEDMCKKKQLAEKYFLPIWAFVAFCWPMTIASVIIYGMLCFYVIGYKSLFGKKNG